MTTNPLSGLSGTAETSTDSQQPPMPDPPAPEVSSEMIADIVNTETPTQQTIADVLEEDKTPPVPEGMNLICTMTPAEFDSFAKTLSILSDGPVISIDESKIRQQYKNGIAILLTDISQIFNKKQISFSILNPKKYVRLFKNLKGNNKVVIVEDVQNQRYVITNKSIKLFIPKPIDETLEDIAVPDLSNSEPLGTTIKLDKETAGQISGLTSNSETGIEFLIHNNTTKGIYVPDTAVYLFPNYVDENIDETSAELQLKSISFLSVPADNYEITLYKTGDKYWLIQKANTGITEITTLEELTPVSDEILI